MILRDFSLNYEKAYEYQSSLKQSLEYFKSHYFPNLLILSGNNKILKYYAIDNYIKHIFCEFQNACGNCKSCLLLSKNEHPDYIIFPEEKIKIGDPEAPEDFTIRWLQEKVLAYKPILQNQRFILFPVAEKIEDEAEIALLKTLEEPVSETKFIFFVKSLDYLKETILSRGVIIKLRNFSIKEMETFVNFYHIHKHEFFEILGGNLDLLNEEYFEIFNNIREKIANSLHHLLDFFELEDWAKEYQIEVMENYKISELEYWDLFSYIFLQNLRKSQKYVSISESLIKFLIAMRSEQPGLSPFLISRLFFEISNLLFF